MILFTAIQKALTTDIFVKIDVFSLKYFLNKFVAELTKYTLSAIFEVILHCKVFIVSHYKKCQTFLQVEYLQMYYPSSTSLKQVFIISTYNFSNFFASNTTSYPALIISFCVFLRLYFS